MVFWRPIVTFSLTLNQTQSRIEAFLHDLGELSPFTLRALNYQAFTGPKKVVPNEGLKSTGNADASVCDDIVEP
jgi:hypothetical protein